jgi:sulfur carrier protein
MNPENLIHLMLDGRPHAVPAGTTLAELVASLAHEPDAVSTARNGLFLARRLREGCVLQDGDAVLMFRPIVGG